MNFVLVGILGNLATRSFLCFKLLDAFNRLKAGRLFYTILFSVFACILVVGDSVKKRRTTGENLSRFKTDYSCGGIKLAT